MSSLPPIPDDISIIAGPPLIGINLSWGLMGVIVVQLCIYAYSFQNDPKIIKGLVIGLGLLELTQTILATIDGFHWFAAGFGNMITLNDPYISAFDTPFMDGISSLVVQFFFAYRIWVLTKSYALSGVVAVVSLTGSVAAMVVGIQGHIHGKLSEIPRLIVAESIWLAGSALADTLIAVIMVTLLLKSRNGLPSTNHVMLRLIRLIIETNTLTAGVAVLTLILFLAFLDRPTTSLSLAYVLGKLYTNTFLAMLNDRILINKDRGVVMKFDSTFSVQHGNTTLSHMGPSNRGSRPAINVGVLRTEVLTRDPELNIPLDDMQKIGESHSMYK